MGALSFPVKFPSAFRPGVALGLNMLRLLLHVLWLLLLHMLRLLLHVLWLNVLRLLLHMLRLLLHVLRLNVLLLLKMLLLLAMGLTPGVAPVCGARMVLRRHVVHRT
jgi:hypothetical protein